MSITGIGGVSPNTGVFAAPRPNFRDNMAQVMSSVAKLFQMSPDQLQGTLAGGQSLGDLATSKGVSRDDLINAIKQGLQAPTTAAGTGGHNAPQFTDTQLDASANRIADHVPGAHHQHHHGGGAQGVQANTSTQSADADGDHDGSTSAAQGAGVAAKLSSTQLADLLSQLRSQLPTGTALPAWMQALGSTGSVDQQA